MPISLALQIGVIVIEEAVWRWIGSIIAFFMGNVVATLTKASPCTFSVRGILLMTHSSN